MQVEVWDKRHNRKRETLTGIYANGVFNYELTSGLFGMHKDPKTLPIDGTQTILSPKGQETAYVWFDGKTYTQIDINSEEKTNTDTAFKDLVRDIKIMELTKRAMITTPKNTFKELLELIALAVIIVGVIGMFIMANDAKSSVAPTVKAINATLAQNQVLIRTYANQSQQLVAQNKEILALLNSYNKSTGGLISAP